MDIAQSTPTGLLHHGLDRLVIAVEIPLHCPVDPGLCPHTIQLCGQFPNRCGKFIPTLQPVGLAKGIAGNGIVGSGDRILGFAQFTLAGLHIPGSIFFPLLSGLQVSLQLIHAALAFPQSIFHAADIRFAACDLGRQFRFLAAQFQELPGNALGIGGHCRHFLLQAFQLVFLLLQQNADLLHAVLRLLHLGCDATAAVIFILHFIPDTGNIGPVVVHIAPQHSHLAIQLLVGRFHHSNLHPGSFQLTVPLAQNLGATFRLGIQAVQILMGLLQHEGRRGKILFRLLCGFRKLFQGVHPDRYFYTLQFVLQLQIFLGLFRLLLQGFQLQFQLRNLITDTHQIFFGVSKFPLGFLLAVPVFGDTRCLFKDLTTVSTLQREDLIDSALADVGVAFSAKAGVHEHLMDIPEPGRLLVDVILAVTAAVIASGDHDLIGIVSQCPIRIIQGQSSFRKTNGSTLLGAAKDHILHLCATQSLGTLLTHDPEDCVGNIRFTGAVGAHDGGDIIAKPDQRLIREGLKALYFQTF